MRNWNTTHRFGPIVLKVFRGVAARDRYNNELETGEFLRSRSIAVAGKICSSTHLLAIVFTRAQGAPLDVLAKGGTSMTVLHDAAKQLAHRTAVDAETPLGWLHRPSDQTDIVSVLRADLERLTAAAHRLNVDATLHQEIDFLANTESTPSRTKILCLADFSPKNLLVDGPRWTVIDLESAIVGPPDVFWAKTALNIVRDMSNPSLAVEEALWCWRQVESESLGRATIVWGLARMCHFRSIVGGPTKDPTYALEGIRLGRTVQEVLAILADA